MNKALLLLSVILILSGCSNNAHQSSAAANRNVFTQNIMQPFNTAPAAKSLYVKFEPKDKPIIRAQSTAINQLLSHIKGQSQHFVINTSEPNELQGEYGTKISIAPDCFITNEGKEAGSEVILELKECYSLDEMLQENLNTTASGKILESKGGIYLAATCNGQQLKLKEGQQIAIQFPFDVNKHNKYAFYYGKNGANGVNWVAKDGADLKSVINNPTFNYKEAGLKNYLVAQLQYPDEAKRNELSANVGVSFTVDKNGKVCDINCVSAYKTFRDEITTALQQMPNWKPATYGERKINAQVKLNIDFNLRRKEQVIVDFAEDNIIAITGDKEDSQTRCPNYPQSFDKMGWINYSHLLDFSAQAMADVVISSDASTDIKLVIKDKNSIVKAGNYLGYSRFTNLPVGTQVYAVGVRTNTAGETFYAMQPLTLDRQTVVALNWKKGDEAAIKAAFKSINVSV